jgi:hypothetical protein
MAQDQLSPDAETLRELAKAGSDLTKPHDIRHWLYFSTEVDAKAAAKELQATAFSLASIAHSSSDAEWRLLAQQTMVPSLPNVEKTSATLEALARHHHGEYDGWETQVVP